MRPMSAWIFVNIGHGYNGIKFNKSNYMKPINLLLLSMLLTVSCNHPNKKDAEEQSTAESIQETRVLEPLTCEFVYINKEKRTADFILKNNTDSWITLYNGLDFEYKDGAEWKKIPYQKREPELIMVGDDPVILANQNYTRRLPLFLYDFDADESFYRITQAYYMRNVDKTNENIDVKYLYQEFNLTPEK